VIGPQDLLAIGQIDRFERLFAGMGGSERDVARGVPVLRQHYIREPLGKAVDHRNNLITILHGKAAAGQETVLNIDDEKRRSIIDLDRSRCPQGPRSDGREGYRTQTSKNLPSVKHVASPWLVEWI
jgi:hypothetical protein